MNKGPQIKSQTGATRGGAPLAMSRAPARDLLPWCYWWSIAEGELPDGVHIECGRVVDQPCITIIYHDAWKAGTADGTLLWQPGPHGRALYFGPQSRCMSLGISGKYIAITLHLNAGAAGLLGFPDAVSMLDRIVDLDEVFGHKVPLGSLVPRDQPYEAWLTALEDGFVRPLVEASGRREPDPVIVDFERQCLANPDVTVEEFARRHDVSKRTIERMVKAAFGITPKQALRRARVLDMAAALLDVARPEDRPEIELRYFDQSHRVKEVRAFFGMSPSELKNGPHPFLRLALEVRQRRRLDALNRLQPDELGPWRDPDSEPRSGARGG
jgi:AraC-like DNA-binding protein